MGNRHQQLRICLRRAVLSVVKPERNHAARLRDALGPTVPSLAHAKKATREAHAPMTSTSALRERTTDRSPSASVTQSPGGQTGARISRDLTNASATKASKGIHAPST